MTLNSCSSCSHHPSDETVGVHHSIWPICCWGWSPEPRVCLASTFPTEVYPQSPDPPLDSPGLQSNILSLCVSLTRAEFLRTLAVGQASSVCWALGKSHDHDHAATLRQRITWREERGRYPGGLSPGFNSVLISLGIQDQPFHLSGPLRCYLLRKAPQDALFLKTAWVFVNLFVEGSPFYIASRIKEINIYENLWKVLNTQSALYALCYMKWKFIAMLNIIMFILETVRGYFTSQQAWCLCSGFLKCACLVIWLAMVVMLCLYPTGVKEKLWLGGHSSSRVGSSACARWWVPYN